MADPLVSVVDLGTRMGKTLSGAEESRAQQILVDVSALARAESGQVWADPGTVSDAVKAVVAAAAYRVFTNPDMYTSRSAGPFSSRIHDSAFATGVFTASELSVLRSQRSKSALWTLSTTRGDSAEETGFLDVVGFGDPFPYYHADDPVNRYGDHY